MRFGFLESKDFKKSALVYAVDRKNAGFYRMFPELLDEKK